MAQDLFSQNPKTFISQYDEDDRRIRFHRNPIPDQEPFDLNEAFRAEVISSVLSNPEDAPLSLLCDLFRAITECASEAWSVDERVEEIGKAMLMKGRTDAVSVYVEGAWQSYDTICATSFVGCPLELAQECLDYASNERIRATKKEEIEKWNFAVQRFEEFKMQGVG